MTVRLRWAGVLAALALFAVGCDRTEGDDAPDTTPIATADGPLVTPEEVTYEEAFPGLPELERPVGMLQVPGTQQMALWLQPGIIHTFHRDGPYDAPSTLLDVSEQVAFAGEQGLLSLAFDPAFEENGYAYIYYYPSDSPQRTVVERLEFAVEDGEVTAVPGSELTIIEIRQPFKNHNGGTLLFGNDGMLYLSLGDGGSNDDPRGNGQNAVDNLLSTVIRIDVNGATAEEPYAIPADNPFVASDIRDEVWAYGLRNPWQMSIDRHTGTIWAADVGEAALEEINIIRPGANYGWSIMEGTECFEADTCDTEGLTLPVAQYGREDGCAVTGGHVYRGIASSELRGWYLYGDHCTGNLWGLDAGRAEAGEGVEPVLFWEGETDITAFAEDADGEVYFLSFAGGKIYRIRA